jgi:3,4-dihydroxy 2-butanone 4-phosphate synthase / GTP cyclohydrolase II
VLVRVHTENVTFAMFGSLIGDTGFQLQSSLERIAAEGRGVVLYLRQREHGLDLRHQLRTYQLMQERGLGLHEASVETGYGQNRDYGVGAQILHELGLRRIRLLTNNPPRVAALEGFDLEVVGNVPLGSPAVAAMTQSETAASKADATQPRRD